MGCWTSTRLKTDSLETHPQQKEAKITNFNIFSLVHVQESRAGAQIWSRIAWKMDGHLRTIPSMFDPMVRNSSIIESNYHVETSKIWRFLPD
jgi:hypothetical protein